MLKNRLSTTVGVAAIAAFAAWSMNAADASAQGTHQHGAHSAGQHDAHSGHQHQVLSPADTSAAPAAQPTPHGGQMSVAGPFRFEVVYRPKETRVYVYDASNRPISARGVQGQAAMTVRGYEKVYRYGMKYVASRAGSRNHDYLALALDVSRIKDGDMSVAFELTGLPGGQPPQATFTQTFALSKTPLKVAVVALTDADRAGVARQKVCAVSGGKLGSMGTPIKVLLGKQPLYLCCKGCIGKVQANPQAYLPRATPTQSVWTCSMHPQIKQAQQGKCPICSMVLVPLSSLSNGNANPAASKTPGTAPAKQITVSTATTADQAAIAQQRVCAVSGGKLGAMGTPLKITANGQSLFICCKGCVGKVEKRPDHYLAKAAQLRAGR